MTVFYLTHDWGDDDGRKCLILAEMFGKGKIYTKDKEIVKMYWDGDVNSLPPMSETDVIVFFDVSPPEEWLKNYRKDQVIIIDHHPMQENVWKENGENWQKYHTATSRLIEFLKLDLNNPKIEILARWSAKSDFFPLKHVTNFAFILKEMNLLYTDDEVQEWYEIMIKAHFLLKSDVLDAKKGLELFESEVRKFLFLEGNEDTPAKKILEKWLSVKKPTKDTMSIQSRTIVNLEVFGEEKTKKWLEMAIKGVEEGQYQFLEAEDIFAAKAEITTLGNNRKKIGVIFLELTEEEAKNKKIPRFTRSTNAQKLFPDSIDGVPIILVMFLLDEEGKLKQFQIFPPSSKYKLDDACAGVRVDTCEIRGIPIPRNWRELKKAGTMKGTEPFYFHKTEYFRGYDVVLWGSPTRNKVPPVDIPKEKLKRTLLIMFDPNLPCKEDCTRQSCEFYKYQMKKCFYFRQKKK